MHMSNLYEAVRQLQHRLDAVDVHRQQVGLYLWGDGITAIRFEMEYSNSPEYGVGYETFKRSLTHDDVSEMLTGGDEGLVSWLDTMIAAANAWIDDIPSAERRAHDAFTKSLGRLIDQGREVGIEVDFLNPLTAMMEKLATNALEDKRNHIE